MDQASPPFEPVPVSSPAVADTVPRTGALVPAPRGELVLRPVPPLAARHTAPSVGGLWKAFSQRKMLALMAGCLLATIAAIVTWIVNPPRYTALAVLRIVPESRLLDDDKRPASPDRLTYQKSEVALLTSYPVMRAALKNPLVAKLPRVQKQTDAVGWLENQLRAGFAEDTDLLQISFSGPDPNEAATLVQAVQEAYLQEIVKGQRTEQQKLYDELEQICATSQENLRRERDVLRSLVETVKTSDSQALTLKQKNLLEEYATLKKELTALQSQQRQAQSKLLLQEKTPTKDGKFPVPSHLVEEQLDNHEEVKKRIAEVAALEMQIEERARVYLPGMGKSKELDDKLAAARERLKQLRAARRDAIEEVLRKRLEEEAEQARRHLREEVGVLKAQEEELRKEVEKIAKEAEKTGTITFQLELKRAENEQAEGVLKTLRNERERLRVELQSTNRRVKVIQAAEPPASPNTAAAVQTASLTGFGAFALGVLGVSFWEHRRRRIHTADDVTHGLGLRVLGSLPELNGKAAARRQNGDIRDPYNDRVLLESVDGIRSVFLCDRAAPATRVVMITSAQGGEGKTHLAGHLAVSLARAGRKTLLIDCDLRRPALHRLFDLPLSPGLSEVLQGQAELAEALHEDVLAGLAVLPAGAYSRQALEALPRAGLQQLLDRLRCDYENVIIDTPPVLPVADALLIGKHADAVLLAVRPRMSQAPLVQLAYDRLTTLSIRVLGAVVNGATSPSLYSRAYLNEVSA
jgi:succinoglycan biosynthesis transport protein ExoP